MNKDEYEDISNKLYDGSALAVGNEQSRFWLETFYIAAKTKRIKETPGLTDSNRGVMLGAQFGSASGGWVFGAFTGFSSGKAHMATDRRNKIKQSHRFYSLYHSMSFKNGWRYDLITQHKPCVQHIDRLTSQGQIAKGRRKSATQFYNVEASYRVKLNERLSLRPNLGVNISNEKIKAFDETEAGDENMHYDRCRSNSREIYTGIGIRNQWIEGEKTDRTVYKLTAVYELGRELLYGGLNVTQTVISTGQTSQGTIPSTGNTAHYLTFYGSMQHNELKFLASYALTLKRYREKHHFSLKTEWRF